MGWNSGSGIAESVWNVIKTHIPKPDHREVAEELINIFESEDCDTMSETTLWEIVYKRCPKCDGTGTLGDTLDGGVKICPKCEETGWLKR